MNHDANLEANRDVNCGGGGGSPPGPAMKTTPVRRLNTRSLPADVGDLPHWARSGELPPAAAATATAQSGGERSTTAPSFYPATSSLYRPASASRYDYLVAASRGLDSCGEVANRTAGHPSPSAASNAGDRWDHPLHKCRYSLSGEDGEGQSWSAVGTASTVQSLGEGGGGGDEDSSPPGGNEWHLNPSRGGGIGSFGAEMRLDVDEPDEQRWQWVPPGGNGHRNVLDPAPPQPLQLRARGGDGGVAGGGGGGLAMKTTGSRLSASLSSPDSSPSVPSVGQERRRDFSGGGGGVGFGDSDGLIANDDHRLREHYEPIQVSELLVESPFDESSPPCPSQSFVAPPLPAAATSHPFYPYRHHGGSLPPASALSSPPALEWSSFPRHSPLAHASPEPHTPSSRRSHSNSLPWVEDVASPYSCGRMQVPCAPPGTSYQPRREDFGGESDRSHTTTRERPQDFAELSRGHMSGAGFGEGGGDLSDEAPDEHNLRPVAPWPAS